MKIEENNILQDFISGTAGPTLAAHIAAAKHSYKVDYQTFTRGELFTAQKRGLGAWLVCAGGYDDLQRWLDFDANAYPAGIACRDYAIYCPTFWVGGNRPDNFDAAYWQVRDFAEQRVIPGLAQRTRVLQDFEWHEKRRTPGGDSAAALANLERAFAKQNYDNGWNWNS